MPGEGGGNNGRYHFNQVGVVREIIYPNKAILAFRLNGTAKEDKAILLSKQLSIDGKVMADPDQGSQGKLMSECLKVNDVVNFDCHVYDKLGPMGSGKDRPQDAQATRNDSGIQSRCNFYAMKAWKNSADYELRNGSGTSGGLIGISASAVPVTAAVAGATANVAGAGGTNGAVITVGGNGKLGTGWVSELNPRKGVLTFDNNGKDERVLFLASKVYFFEKRIGSKQPLTDLLSEGDPVQFEAVPCGAEGGGSEGANPSNSYCTWFANLVWKGKRPAVESTFKNAQLSQQVRRGSCDSSSDSEYYNTHHSTEEYIAYGHKHTNPDIVEGVGMIAKIVNDKAGVIWWVKSYNQFHSVWFTSNKTFLFGTNLANKSLSDIFREGDPVSIVAEKANSLNCPAKWIAKQVLISDDTAALLQKANEPPAPSENCSR